MRRQHYEPGGGLPPDTVSAWISATSPQHWEKSVPVITGPQQQGQTKGDRISLSRYHSTSGVGGAPEARIQQVPLLMESAGPSLLTPAPAQPAKGQRHFPRWGSRQETGTLSCWPWEERETTLPHILSSMAEGVHLTWGVVILTEVTPCHRLS